MKSFTVILCALLTANAHSMSPRDTPVKCTMADGRISYQTGSCPAGSKIEVVRDSTSSVPSVAGWQFSRNTDSMTGTSTCNAVSPSFTIPSKHSYPSALIVVTVSTTGPSITVVSLDSNTIFHHNISGTGIKVGNGAMRQFAARPTQTTLVAPPSEAQALIGEMLYAGSARLRVRYWPWDNTYDSPDIQLQGFKQAYTLATKCAGL